MLEPKHLSQAFIAAVRASTCCPTHTSAMSWRLKRNMAEHGAKMKPEKRDEMLAVIACLDGSCGLGAEA